MTPADYLPIAAHYDACLARFGDTAQGADWPNEADRARRFDVMLDVGASNGEPATVCDLGCGTGELYRHIRSRGLGKLEYRGIDISRAAIGYARRKFPGVPFLVADVLTLCDAEFERLLACDYLVMNGLFTVKRDLSAEEMWRFLQSVVERAWPYVRRGLAFNVMSKQVERDDLFHLSLDDAAAFLHRLAGRSARFRADYGLYEYTAYAFKSAAPGQSAAGVPPAYADPPAAPGQLDEAPSVPFVATGQLEARAAIPVCAPRLASAERLRPYLERIDRERWYSNHGPLASLLQARLSTHFSLPPHAITLAASGTAALVAAILGRAGRAKAERPIGLCPSYSFVATASAIQQCGYTPRFVDIARETFSLDPERLRKEERLDDAGLIVVVAPYGRPVDQVSWQAFQEETGIPVVLDAAAGFDQLRASGAGPPGVLPTAVSLHATKVFGTGEGGLVIVQDPHVSERCGRALNFGFSGSRDSIGPSINGKMSEYHAAVGLAELDCWPEKRARFLAVAQAYARTADELGIGDRVLCDGARASCYTLFAASDEREAGAVQAALTRERIDYRLWYGTGIHNQPFYREFPRSSLEVTAAIAPLLIGLPMAVDLSEGDVWHILSILRSALDG